MKNKTVLQELKDELQECLDLSTNPFITTSLKLSLGMVEDKLEKEKRQIIEAYSYGMGHYGDANSSFEGEKYFNKHYK